MKPRRSTFAERLLRAGALVAAAAIGGWVPALAQTTGQIRIAWDANVEPDLAGYRVFAHTDPNVLTAPRTPAQAALVAVTVSVGKTVTQQLVTGLDPNRVWFFAVTALDLSGNESGFSSPLVSAQPSVTPVVRTVSPATAEQGTTGLSITISGSNFVAASTVSFGDPNNVRVNALNTAGVPSTLVANVDVRPLARVAARDVVVTNPGGVSGTKPAGFTVTIDVARLDIDLSGRIDNADFLDILAGFPSVSGDTNYLVRRDLDVDGKVDGADLAIFFTFFGLVAPFP